MKKLRILLVLMGITLAAITGFQLYWLKENYAREKKTLAIKTRVSFGEIMRHLQAKKLRLSQGMGIDTGKKGEVKVFIRTDESSVPELPIPRKGEIVSTINVIRDNVMDSIRKNFPEHKRVVISMDKSGMELTHDSMNIMQRLPHNPGGEEHIFNLLYGVDSLQDSIRIDEINKAFTTDLAKQEINIPFSITRIDSIDFRVPPTPNEISIGFAHPITYRFEMGNTFSYLLNKISLPILFSILLLGITILSFVLLYRNLVRQQRLAELKNEFISNITHELKTPIATVSVAIEALKQFNAINDPLRTKEYLDISANELQRLSLLVDKVLKLSMFEKKEMDMKFETVNLEEIVKEVLASMKLQIDKCHAVCSLRLAGDASLKADRLHLLSIVFNLLDNALKYSKENPKIDIEINGTEKAVTVKVRDNGIGIPAAYQGKVFDKFFRVPHGDTHDAKGYGLGLSYTAQVIHKHGGTITVESTPATGTCFTFVLPKYHT